MSSPGALRDFSCDSAMLSPVEQKFSVNMLGSLSEQDAECKYSFPCFV